MSNKKAFIAIDLKSFYASVECVDRGLDPLNTNLVVADLSRTNKTICLAVSPSLKSFGLPGRPRLYEVEQLIKKLNQKRRYKNQNKLLIDKSYFYDELIQDESLAIDYIVAPPRMSTYIDFSRDIYNVYLKYISAEDIHVYSIDEVFIDASAYLKTYNMTAHELALKMIKDVLNKTGVTATAGIGDNLYLAKVAMDIVAKKMPADEDGVRIAELDEKSYREILWDHEPITDFWRVGAGYQRRLEKYHLYTMGDIARFSLKNDGLLYDEFGINAELLIDHAWGYESCSMKDIKSYVPQSSSTGVGQVLMEPYTFDKAKIVCKEMVDGLVLDLIYKNLMCDHVSLSVNYDTSNDLDNYGGVITNNYYGKKVAKPSAASMSLNEFTNSRKKIMKAFVEMFDKVVNKDLLIRRININADRVLISEEAKKIERNVQYDLFTDIAAEEKKMEEEKVYQEKEENLQKAILNIKSRFGKNAIMKGTNLEEGATGLMRNKQIGGHHE